MNHIGKPLISFIVYLSRETSFLSVQSFLKNLKSLDAAKDFQLIFINASHDEEIWKEIQNYLNQFKIFYFKISSDLGESYAYNLALPYIKGKYCQFISPIYTLDSQYFSIINSTTKKGTISPDLITIYNQNSINHDHFQKKVYKGLSSELILSLNTNLRYYVINSEFLINSKIRFHDFNFHPFTFVIYLLIDAHLIAFIEPQIITCCFPPSDSFNVYDILYQAYEILSFLNLKGVYEKYIDEWNYLLVVIVYHVFLKVLVRAYKIDINNKKSMKKNHQLLNFAIISIKNIINKLKIKISENKYIQMNQDSIFDIYTKITKAIK